ncbi:MAG: shikimate dehydrogenase [Candidatus Omnitrophica bacterium]|nr:shikimate dehydrogenase [Candidatus Omnitrophota bacterium]MBI5145339.1 shikimate dehydrogenase [Candidatus Omnitrophota bacterium]
MDKDPRKLIFGILGFPVGHSLSPVMHNAAFRSLKINARYRLFEKRPQDLAGFLSSLAQANIRGLNVTVPYKEKVIRFLDKISPEAKLIGAVNTIKISKDKLFGFNTDGQGFLKHLKNDLKFNPRGKNVALIGAGGAGRAVSVYLAKAGARSIAIYDVEKNKSSVLLKHLKEKFKNREIILADSIAELKIRDCDLLINATPVGLKKNTPSLVAGEFLHPHLLVYDLVYNPKETQLLKIAKKKGCLVSNGLGMLLYQGAISFKIWTAKSAPLEVMRQALKEALKR